MNIRHLVALLALGAIWGASFLFIKLALVDIPPLTIVACRLMLATVLFMLIARARGVGLDLRGRRWRDYLVVGLLGTAVPFALISWGVVYVTSGLASILNATTPLFTLLVGLGFNREDRLGPIRLVGTLVGFAGVVVAVGPETLVVRSMTLLGVVAVLAAALCYALSSTYGRSAFRGISPLAPASGQMLMGTIIMVPAALLVEGLPARVPGLVPLLAIVALAVPGSVVAYLLFYYLLDRVGATRTSMVTYLLPPFALVYGTLLLAEPLTPQMLAGLVLVLFGILLANGALDQVVARLAGHRPVARPDQ